MSMLTVRAAAGSEVDIVEKTGAKEVDADVMEALAAERLQQLLAADGKMSVETSLVMTPKDGYQVMVDKGIANSKASSFKIFASSTLGGFYVAMGGMLSLAIAGNIPGVAAQNPGFIKLVFAALFPVNLLMALMTGAQLFTGNTANMAASIYEGETNTRDLARAWVVSWIGNIVGCGCYALAAYYTGCLDGGAGALAIKTAAGKTSMPWGVCFCKAIMCNWLVCMAVYLCGCAKDLTGKMVGIWWPITTFVAIGFEHSVANMFILPAAILAGAPLTFSDIMLTNLIPVTLGNAVAGVFFMSGGMSIMHGKLGAGK